MQTSDEKIPTLVAVDYEIGEFVYLRTDPGQSRRLVTAIIVRHDSLRYILAIGDYETTHSALEIDREKNSSTLLM